MLKYFNDENDAKEQAKKEIREILSNKTYINPDKFNQLLNDYRKRQIELDSEISVAIKTQVILVSLDLHPRSIICKQLKSWSTQVERI